MKVKARSDFSDVNEFFQKGMSEIRMKVDSIGKKAVEYAKANGNYKNRTGNLRASNRHEVDGINLRLINDMDYASNVESKGYDVLTGAALFAEAKLKSEIG